MEKSPGSKELEYAKRTKRITIYLVCVLVISGTYKFFDRVWGAMSEDNYLNFYIVGPVEGLLDGIAKAIDPLVVQYGIQSESLIMLVLLLIGLVLVIVLCFLIMRNLLGVAKLLFQ
ncbi:MAG: hypothetical protein A7316_02920 [Candidatus Altiarchaeales archaeon WOR_SM1_86-2]|nr:MAG: hypothetical protein A7316_02920 [Candidatus Altiarchaeales archaeon WOR_SM1_86-2]ODS40821.1 MAG: hypothetical protein A7315_07590 [Candidatus Altiarchaeales archaeon WOR_SM1_79]